mgnify:CR=1 FL=1|jgi:hypothetical protein
MAIGKENPWQATGFLDWSANKGGDFTVITRDMTGHGR